MVNKASELTLQDLFRRNEEQNSDFLRDYRMIISSADAWGVLTRDLIMALGIERAKRFLLRYGRHFGIHEARLLKDAFPWKDQLEWVIAGSRMHDISGRVSSVPIRLDIDTETCHFDVEGYWYNSYEAKQYLHHFPHHHEPVCYFLVGYAGGYCSEALGKRVIFKEMECVAKGDPYCRYAGKTVELWGDEISEELIDYEAEDIGNELDRAYKRIERQREHLKLSAELNQELTQIVLQGKGLHTIVESLGNHLQCRVIIENQYFEPIAHHGDVAGFELGHVLAQLRRIAPHTYAQIAEKLDERQTQQLDILTPDELVHYRLITPIIFHNSINGYVSIIKSDNNFRELDSIFLERAANVCAFQMLTERTAIETEQRLKGDLLDEILTKPALDSYAAHRLSYLGYQMEQPAYVFLFQFDFSKQHTVAGSEEKLRADAKEQITKSLIRQMEAAGFKPLISIRYDRIHTVIPQEFLEKIKTDPKRFGESLLAQLRGESASIAVVLGISSKCEQADSLHAGYKATVKAIEICKLKGNRTQVILAGELGHLAILLDARAPEELEAYAMKLLGTLIAYDKQYSSEYVKTLHYYFENECNLHKTARAMNVSISGMRYRFARIKDLTDLDFNSSSVRFEIQMALEILFVLGKVAW